MPLKTYSYNDTTTHPHITERAIKYSLINSYLQTRLGLKPYVDEDNPGTLFNGRIVTDIIAQGSEEEDNPMCRASNNFHDPYKPDWSSAGLSDTMWLANLWCEDGIYPPEEITSNLVWATGFADKLTLLEPETYNDSDWGDARLYFFIYLTTYFNGVEVPPSPEISESERNIFLRLTFISIGQVMHLLQDTAVPAHVRNDFSQGHTTFKKSPGNLLSPSTWYGNAFEKYVQINDKDPQKSWFEQSPLKLNFIDGQVTDFWDTDQLQPEPASPPTNMETLGLSEYTSMNFVSEYSMFMPGFPYPKVEQCTVVFLPPPPGSWFPLIGRQYISSTNGHPGEQVNHLAVISYLNNFKKVYFPQISSIELPLGMDENCYNEYAEKLIPRAIGYSSQLLDYFFRGTIDILPPDDGVYGLIDGSNDPQQFTTLKCKLMNTTENDEMNEGDLIAVAKYKKRLDYQPDLSADPPSSASREDEFSISVSSPYHITSLSNSTAEAFEFDFSSSPIPAGITDLYLQVVFKGNLGNETGENGEPGNAIAVGMKDLYEPAHITILNSTDMFYLNGGVWTSQEIRDDPDLLDLVDFDDDGIVNELLEPYIDPYDNELWLTFYPADASAPTEHHLYWNAIPPGRIGRLILLTDSSPLFVDMERKPSYKDVIWSNTYTMETGIVNQDDGNDNFQTTNVFSFRGNITYDGTALFSDGETTGIMSAPWPDITETEPIPATDLNTSPAYQ